VVVVDTKAAILSSAVVAPVGNMAQCFDNPEGISSPLEIVKIFEFVWSYANNPKTLFKDASFSIHTLTCLPLSQGSITILPKEKPSP